MSAVRTTVSIPERVHAMAEEAMDVRAFDEFSGYLQQLIREDHERLFGVVRNAPAAEPAVSRQAWAGPRERTLQARVAMELVSQVQALADARGADKSDIVREALIRFIEANSTTNQGGAV